MTTEISQCTKQGEILDVKVYKICWSWRYIDVIFRYWKWAKPSLKVVHVFIQFCYEPIDIIKLVSYSPRSAATYCRSITVCTVGLTVFHEIFPNISTLRLWMWEYPGIFCGILWVPQNSVMNLNKVVAYFVNVHIVICVGVDSTH